ncbi:LPXTG-motif cell wall-anchored protein [Paenibacillus anaericanus]|uniref:collagen binding domain-containing protein n=1 Tax=Paenibacillus anaericanus TaxID=170367 RepID=UPI00277E00B4|nr:collagen binding domain-containing protein [Paenibacillus anaericanus]MDQ0087340.1 LPXTG-motif cell wall-anchored protein [Paenibacillus anaericanus]
MSKFKKTLFLFLVFILMLNIVVPSSLTRAEGESEDPAVTTQQSVTDDDAGRSLLSVTQSVYEITDNIITSVIIKNELGEDISQVRPAQGSKVSIDFTWELPLGHGYTAGSIFTFDLPNKFKLDSKKTGDLDEYGTFEVTPEGKVTFYFDEDIEDTVVTDGTFNVWRQFDNNKFTGGTKQDITFLFQGDTDSIPVHFISNTSKKIEKRGTANKGKNASKIDWEVDFNIGEQSINNAIFADVLPTGLQIDMATIKVIELVVNLDGSVVEKSTPFIGNPPVATTNGFQLDFGNIHSAYRVKYTTDITSPTNKDYANNVSVTGDSPFTTLNDSKSVTVTYSEPLNKTSSAYESTTQTITWKVEYNYNEQPFVASNAWIEDTFNVATQELIDDSFIVYKMKIADSGNASRDGLPLNNGTDYNVVDTATGFKLTFTNDINSAYEIVYKTKSIPRVYADTVPVTNTVKMYGGTTKDGSRNMNQVIFHKNNGTVNFSEKEIDWTINLNRDNKVMNTVVITDSFVASQGLTFLPDRLEIGNLEKDIDYTVAPKSSYSEGFIITFITPISSSQLIKYTTKFDSKIKVSQYKNTADLDWKEGTVQQTKITKTGTANPDNYTTDNGNKTGTYNAATKEITWTVDVNYNLHTITEAVLQDFYTGKQTFVKGSLTMAPLTLTGGSNGVEPGTAVIVPDSQVDYTVKDNDGNDGFKLTLGSINSAYRITYKTSLVGHPVVVDYKNNATLSGKENGVDKNLFNKKATVTPANGGKYINKTGSQGTGADLDFAYWKVNINSSQSHVDAGAEVTDTLSANQILIQDSFKLYATNPNGDLSKAGEVDAADYTLVVDGNTFTLTFKKELERAYILEYKSFINADNNEMISNMAKFAGQSAGVVDKNENEEFAVDFSGAGGGATTPKGDLTVVKVDAANSAVTLEGAVFGLYDKTGNTLIKTQATGADGKAVFENIKYKDYMLRELSAPPGYLYDVDYKAGKVITFNATKNTIQVENTKGVWDFELTKVNVDDQAEVLAGAHFKLQLKNSSGQYEDVPEYADLVTLLDGKISYKGLVKGGQYQLVETKAPRGYSLDSTPITFTIDENQKVTQTHTVTNAKNVGLVELLKTDEFDSTPLAGVVFKLQDLAGQLVQNGYYTTDQDGKILVSNLKAGKYQFIEDVANPDYILDQLPNDFEIVDNGVTVGVWMTNEQIPGSVKLTKIETGRPDIKLPGAKFSILNELKIVVLDSAGNKLDGLTTDQNGEIVVPDLRPGKYYFEETIAPKGYIINVKTKLTEFEIVKDEETLVTIENNRFISSGGGGGGGGGITPTPSPTPTPTPGPTPTPTPEPTEPVDPNPGTPVSPEPEKPAKPKEKVTTPKQTPVKGKIGVPKDKTPKVSEKPKHGKVTVDPEGKWVYTPDKDYVGEDSFKIKVTDKDGNEEVYAVEVDVLPKDGTAGDTASSTGTGKTLPKTGESSQLPLQLAGLSLVILGTALLILRKKRLLHK